MKKAREKNWVNLPKEQTFDIRKRISEKSKEKAWAKYPEKYPEKYPGLMKQKVEKTREYYSKYPERHPNITMSKNKSITNPESKLFNICKKMFPSTNRRTLKIYDKNNKFLKIKTLDMIIEELKLCVEYDGSYWHQNKEYDLYRQEQIEKEGWKFLRYVDYIPNKQELLKNINEVLKNV